MLKTHDQKWIQVCFPYKENGGYVTFRDNWKGRIVGQGNIGNDTSSLIENVLLVDGLKHNLLSTSQLCEKGFKVIFEASHCIIKDIQNDKTIFMRHRCDNIYAINISKYEGHDRCFSSMHDQSWYGIGGWDMLTWTSFLNSTKMKLLEAFPK